MPPKFQNKYRIPSARLQSWDYGSNAAYFVTICTKNREYFFGEIVDSIVETQCIASLQPTPIGIIVEQEWIKSVELRPDMNLELGEFIVMPNHFHGIMIIGENRYNCRTPCMASQRSTTNSVHNQKTWRQSFVDLNHR